ADDENEKSTTPSVGQPPGVEVPGDMMEPQPSTSGKQRSEDRPALLASLSVSSDQESGASMPTLETDLQS
ncbi:hypothetical protein B5X24_HaOG216093, partial [Helicoverpa armigera]